MVLAKDYEYGEQRNAEDIVRAFPELTKYIKWHGCTSDGPLYYLENTLYHVSDKDYNGYKKDEYSAYIERVITYDITKTGCAVCLY